jgi:hypothetical protein
MGARDLATFEVDRGRDTGSGCRHQSPTGNEQVALRG